jgi:sugar phosphate isomerase/epimerase
MNTPKLACPNLFTDVEELKCFALDYGFQGIDWTLCREDLNNYRLEESLFVSAMSKLAPLEVRYHLVFLDNEIGAADCRKASSATAVFHSALELISKVSGRFATVHIGLGIETMRDISWERTIAGLIDLRARAQALGIRLCLENLASGWTGRPSLYEKLIRKTNCWGILDMGHALVCQSVASQAYDIQDFALPHPERILGAHIYHEETSAGHIPPFHYSDLVERLSLLRRLPLCDWWVLELRDEDSLLHTLECVKGYLQAHEARVAI